MPNDPKQEVFQPNREKFEVLVDSDGPAVMIVTIPVDAYAKDTENGMALLHGKLREAAALGSKEITMIRMKAAQKGLIKAGPSAKLSVQ